MNTRLRGVVLAAIMIVGLAVTACSSNSTSPPARSPQATASGTPVAVVACAHAASVKDAKTKFVAHAGLGTGAFYKFLYKPFKDGKFKAHAKDRTKAMAVGGGAALFTAAELTDAKKDAEADKTLCKLVAPIDALDARLTLLGAGLTSGKLDAKAIRGARKDLASFTTQSAVLGVKVKQIKPASLGSFGS
jgi:hypothetical protein